jgi:hypothetical protein
MFRFQRTDNPRMGKRQLRTATKIAEIRLNFANRLSQDCRFRAIAAIDSVKALMTSVSKGIDVRRRYIQRLDAHTNGDTGA